ncbi:MULTISPECIES: hypothetical protein [Dehalobacter]|uniref:hypothetical protein n=1 Tax=Dehalobacter TaxID=56112 RepID=UPI0002D7D103|nr:MULTISPECIES: hypothetical protein [Dehalobacter]
MAVYVTANANLDVNPELNTDIIANIYPAINTDISKHMKENSRELYVSFEYSAERVEKIRTIQGRIWDSEKKHWIVPYSKETIINLFKLFPNEIIINSKIPKRLGIDTIIENHIFDRMQKELKIQGYSHNTTSVYVDNVFCFLFIKIRRTLRIKISKIICCIFWKNRNVPMPMQIKQLALLNFYFVVF